MARNDNLRKRENVRDEGDSIYSPVFETDVYLFTVDTAYVDESDGGASFMALSLIAEDGRTMKATIYYTSGNDKGNSITYPVKKNGKPTGEERYLPGYILASDIHELITEGEELADMNTEEKLVKAWDKDAGAERPMEKDVLVDFEGKQIKLAVQQQQVFKTVNRDGKYVETDEIIKRNEVVKAFDFESNQTVSEINAEEDATFMDKWITNYKGVVFDRTKKKSDDSDSSRSSRSSGKKSGGKKKKMFE